MYSIYQKILNGFDSAFPLILDLAGPVFHLRREHPQHILDRASDGGGGGQRGRGGGL